MLAQVLPLMADLDWMQVVGRTALDVLLAEPGIDGDRIVAFGYGAGGRIVLQLVRTGVPFRALAAIHPGLPAPRGEDWAAVPGPFLICTGSQDPLCTPDQVLTFGRALQKAGVDWHKQICGGTQHAFWAAPTTVDGSPTGESTRAQSTVPVWATTGRTRRGPGGRWSTCSTRLPDRRRSRIEGRLPHSGRRQFPRRRRAQSYQ